MAEKEKIADLILEKFVNEEIMTKSEFQLSIDRIIYLYFYEQVDLI